MQTEKILPRRYYSGLKLEKDLKMCELYDEFEKDKRFEIVKSGRNVEVIEMEYINNYSNDRRETGKTHIGFEFHYISVKYGDYIIVITPSSYYPFTDEDNPAPINMMFFRIIEDNKCHQCSYSYGITHPEDIINMIKSDRSKHWVCIKDAPDKQINY